MTARAGLLALAVAALVAGGCGAPSNPTPHERTGQVSEDIRHDIDPLTKYFPLIGNPVAASWLGWSNASGAAPGPSMYWIDAVVELRPETAAALRARYAPAEPAAPAVKDALRQAVPDGPYLTGREFDIALGGSKQWGGNARGYLHHDRPLLVFQAISGG
ncbi:MULTISPECIES: hypothetical protein [unclassified Nocardia]|uniref:hypothetical protein n=1 Tax=unclassified Nocardia TaxID=2637762 RepID=UPI001CE3CA48|nr:MULTISPECIES: hypothetical protein [unclassified Nocardia]